MAVARTGVVSLDCADARPLAEFWAAMLGGEIVFRRPRIAAGCFSIPRVIRSA